MNLLIAVLSLSLLLCCTAASGEEGCKYDTQCKGERICHEGVCIESPSLKDIFPPKSTKPPSNLLNLRVIKTTRLECEKRGGEFRAYEDMQGGDLGRCYLPAGK